MLEMSLISVFLVGLLGGGHCVGMCGGIVSAVSASLPQQKTQWHLLLAYNLGRILSYSVAGLLAGALGASGFFLKHVLPIEQVLYGLANVMLILLGLYLAGLGRALASIEALGKSIWQYIQPLGKRFLPVRSVPQAIGLGLVWGWLPCGLVYSVLIAALATANAAQGALLMFCFGLGTLPTLLLMGLASLRLKLYLQQPWLRLLCGIVVAGFGVWGLMHLFGLTKRLFF